jgi:glycosyltransferase involved in cell wall biosynthesis
MATLRREIVLGDYKFVMFASYAEYFAPLWAPGFRKLSRNGVVFGAVIQEPVRNFRVGPEWWHRRSIAEAYSFLKFAFVHDNVVLDTGREMKELKTVVIPYGPHQFPSPLESRDQVRQRLGIPKDVILLLSFGHIRDNKNLDFCVRALKEIPEAFLLVAGKRNASSQRPESYYIELAESLGVSQRCKWIIDYVSEEEAANLFTASDLVLLTYNSSFRSASGVLHLAARYGKQSLVSAGQGSLRSVVTRYRIGLWIEPDLPETVVAGIRDWMTQPPQPDWEGYRNDNSWLQNARIVLNALTDDLEIESRLDEQTS